MMVLFYLPVSAIDTLNRAVSTLAVVGTGLLGGSVGLGLAAAGFQGRVVGVGRRAQTLRRAVDLGCAHEGTTDLAGAVKRSDLVVLATPLGRFEPLLVQIAEHDRDGLMITDVGSTKHQVCADARRILPVPQRFVGSHPMAGSEQQGPQAATAGLFSGKPCIITPENDADARTLETVESLWTVLGMRVLKMSPAQHDRQTAVISHLPHAVSVLLFQVAAAMEATDIASTGFHDTTRLASSNPTMRADIMMANREQLLAAMDAFGREMDTLKRSLANADADALKRTLERIKTSRDDWLDARPGGES